MADAPHIMIVEARYYVPIADEMIRGAIAALE
ncbi:MAG: 6,7-dimethyl-8-ribityllumazine synthase, partial [Rhodospirillales bacterium]|nr:6,7-dimethyl-8-ribityllumazine synthase [Rhodospirillales bacterium]